ncbi:MAG: hypothetical protein ACPGPS_03885, partial [Rubripirellula sp.]
IEVKNRSLSQIWLVAALFNRDRNPRALTKPTRGLPTTQMPPRDSPQATFAEQENKVSPKLSP